MEGWAGSGWPPAPGPYPPHPPQPPLASMQGPAFWAGPPHPAGMQSPVQHPLQQQQYGYRPAALHAMQAPPLRPVFGGPRGPPPHGRAAPWPQPGPGWLSHRQFPLPGQHNLGLPGQPTMMLPPQPRGGLWRGQGQPVNHIARRGSSGSAEYGGRDHSGEIRISPASAAWLAEATGQGNLGRPAAGQPPQPPQPPAQPDWQRPSPGLGTRPAVVSVVVPLTTSRAQASSRGTFLAAAADAATPGPLQAERTTAGAAVPPPPPPLPMAVQAGDTAAAANSRQQAKPALIMHSKPVGTQAVPASNQVPTQLGTASNVRPKTQIQTQSAVLPQRPLPKQHQEQQQHGQQQQQLAPPQLPKQQQQKQEQQQQQPRALPAATKTLKIRRASAPGQRAAARPIASAPQPAAGAVQQTGLAPPATTAVTVPPHKKPRPQQQAASASGNTTAGAGAGSAAAGSVPQGQAGPSMDRQATLPVFEEPPSVAHHHQQQQQQQALPVQAGQQQPLPAQLTQPQPPEEVGSRRPSQPLQVLVPQLPSQVKEEQEEQPQRKERTQQTGQPQLEGQLQREQQQQQQQAKGMQQEQQQEQQQRTPRAQRGPILAAGADGPGALDLQQLVPARRTLLGSLCIVRGQVQGGLATVERLLLERSTGVSVLQGALVRVLTTRGCYRLRPITCTSLAPDGQLCLRVAGIAALVAADAVSSKSPFFSHQWQTTGKQELAELAAWAGREVPDPPAQLTLGVVAKALHRLEVASLWQDHLVQLAEQKEGLQAVPKEQAKQLLAELCDASAIHAKASWLLQEAASPARAAPGAASAAAAAAEGCSAGTGMDAAAARQVPTLPPGFLATPRDPRRRPTSASFQAVAGTSFPAAANVTCPAAAALQQQAAAVAGKVPGGPGSGGSCNSSGESLYALMGRLLAERSPAMLPPKPPLPPAQQHARRQAEREATEGREAAEKVLANACKAGTGGDALTPQSQHVSLPPGFGSSTGGTALGSKGQRQAQSLQWRPANPGVAARPGAATALPETGTGGRAALPAKGRHVAAGAAAAATAVASSAEELTVFEEAERRAIRSLFDDSDADSDSDGDGGSAMECSPPEEGSSDGERTSSDMECSQPGPGKRGKKRGPQADAGIGIQRGAAKRRLKGHAA